MSAMGLLGCANRLQGINSANSENRTVLGLASLEEEDKALAELLVMKPVQLLGVARLKDFPGAPNYNSIAKGDECERVWVLKSETLGATQDYQLVLFEDADKHRSQLRKYAGKKVFINGLMWRAHTGHHHTPFLITVKSVTSQAR